MTDVETAARQQLAPLQIRCAEIWGGILAIDAEVATAGLSASLFSTAHDGDRGGDMYYVSVCKWDYLTRIAVADLRGHGEQVSRLSAWVYESMEKRMNTISGHKILVDLNSAVHAYRFDAITTAAVIGYHARKKKLYFSYAGHPPAYLQRGGDAWQPLNLPHRSGPSNLPLGVLRNVKYDVEEVKMEPGNRICLYTDGVTDCTRPDGEPFGDKRLADSLNRHAGLSPAALKTAIVDDLKDHRGECSPDDDMTLLIAEIR